jgi:hypothetical protein
LFLNVKSYDNIKPEISGDDLKFLRRPTHTTTVSEEVLRWIGAEHQPIPFSITQAKHCPIALKITNQLLHL